MKQLTCAQMGGPDTCTAVISGATPEEMAANGMTHVNEAHPDMAENIKKMSKEEMDKWMNEFLDPKFAAAPETA